MVLQQLERLQKDSTELEVYAKRLEKRGRLKKMKNILSKKDFIDKRIKLISEPEVAFST
tara:strand:+ start:105 stop:281 length:177 start_codon:yes stop_codon:yes gene_type:complete